MNYLFIIFLLSFSSCNLVLAKRVFETVAIFEELQKLNRTCSYGLSDYCPRGGALCDCGISCAQLGTCCLTSPYRELAEPKVKPKCRDPGYWMVSECPQSSRSESPYEVLCSEDAKDKSDLMLFAPVTSAYTHVTYKNYFCFRCHESNDDHIFWNVNIGYGGITDVKFDDENFQFAYDEYNSTWVAPVGRGGSLQPVILHFEVPKSIFYLAKTCSHRIIISDCPLNWLDDDIRAKCGAYMLLTHITEGGTYRNPHCALCNFENIDNAYCPYIILYSKIPFSFSFLLDVNRSKGDKVGKIVRCISNNVWDPYFKKCRPLSCAIPTYTVQEGKCVRPQ